MFHPFVQSVGGAGFDPSTLANLTGLFRNYAGAPWASSPGSTSMASGGTAPGTSTLNSHGTATFNGTTQTFNGSAGSNYFNITALSGWVLINVNSIATNNTGSPTLNDSILSTNGVSSFSLYLRSAGPTVGLEIFNGTTNPIVEVSIATGGWHLVQYKVNSTNLFLRVDNGGGSGFTTAVSGGGVNSFAANLMCGVDIGGTHFLNGTIAEMGMSNAVQTDATFDQIRAYCNSRYGVSV